MGRPSGTVTFLFTDVEGSTRRWEDDPEAMRAALAAHDLVLRSAVEAHGGWLFKNTGDGVCAAFASARAAIDASVDAQRSLELPVRMGISTGEAELRGEDYVGAALNRAARVMAAGHGGQILVAAATAALVSREGLVDRGEHRLRDLRGAEQLFQVRADGLGSDFPPLRTLDDTPGNLPTQLTSFVGREADVKELIELVRARRLVTLTGVGGVGKTRLAVQVAAEVITEFPDGVWFVELAPVGDPAAVPDAVATVLGVTPQARQPVADSIASALSGRRLLIVLDNCEHLLDAAAALVETVLAGTTTVKVIATSREGLRVGPEHLWPVPPLDLAGGASSAAVELFVGRARSLNPGFELEDQARAEAVTEICRRLDGIALAIELAAARMVSMSPQDVRDRLGDRFRLLAGSPRGLERHRTLLHAVEWSYELLDDDERMVLCRCSVFADGFDLVAAVQVCLGTGFDEYRVLDALDSLVRKSLVTAEQTQGHARFGMLETIRQFAEDRLAASGAMHEVRERHARFFADEAVRHWDIWNGPDQRVALDWVDTEFANLRAGFRFANDRGDLATATAIAAHGALLAWVLQRFEPVVWVEEILPAATAAEVVQLPRLYTAAGVCRFTGRPEAAGEYAHRAVVLEEDPRFDPVEPGLSSMFEAGAHRYAGRLDRSFEICTILSTQTGLPHVAGLCGMTWAPSTVEWAERAPRVAEEALTAARAYGNPFWIAYALLGCGRAFADRDPTRALTSFRQGLSYARDHLLPFWQARIAREAAALEAVHGDLEQALTLFDTTIDSFHRAGDHANVGGTLADLATFFDRIERPESAATLYGASTHYGLVNLLRNMPNVVANLKAALGETRFDTCVATGAAMDGIDAVQYAREQMQLARHDLESKDSS